MGKYCHARTVNSTSREAGHARHSLTTGAVERRCGCSVWKRKRAEHKLSSRPWHRKSTLAQLSPILGEVSQRPHIAFWTRSRSSPSDACSIRREAWVAQLQRGGSPFVNVSTNKQNTPMYHKVAAAVVPRLQAYLKQGGYRRPVASDQAGNGRGIRTLCGSRKRQRELPDTIRRRIERCLCESIDVLVERGLISSGDVLAEVLPQLTSGLRAAGITDPSLRQLYAAIYSCVSSASVSAAA